MNDGRSPWHQNLLSRTDSVGSTIIVAKALAIYMGQGIRDVDIRVKMKDRQIIVAFECKKIEIIDR